MLWGLGFRVEGKPAGAGSDNARGRDLPHAALGPARAGNKAAPWFFRCSQACFQRGTSSSEGSETGRRRELPSERGDWRPITMWRRVRTLSQLERFSGEASLFFVMLRKWCSLAKWRPRIFCETIAQWLFSSWGLSISGVESVLRNEWRLWATLKRPLTKSQCPPVAVIVWGGGITCLETVPTLQSLLRCLTLI